MDEPSQLRVLPGGESRSLSALDDDELALLSGAGQKTAFSILASRYLARLTNFCGKFAGNRRIGEELAQETLLQVWRSCRSYKANGRFVAYLFTIARNRCRNHLRDSGRRQRFELGLSREAVHGPTDASHLGTLVEEERCRRVHEALASLPLKLREAMLLRFDQELSYADIARIIRRPEATARTRVLRAVRKLRADMAQEEQS